MNVSTRGGFLAGAACAALVRQPASAAEFSYRLSCVLTADHPNPLRLVEAAGQVRADTGGRLDITVFPNGTLGGDAAVFSQVRSGAVQMMLVGGPIVAQTIPVVGIDGTGFAFPGYKALWAALDGDLGTLERAAILQNGLYALAKAWDGGFRQVTTGTKPVASPDDLRGFKIRVPEAAIPVSLFRALGASPTPIAASEMYTALQTKVVDGQENPLINIETNRIYEVQKYCSLTSHMWNGHWLVVNGDAWNALPKPVQTSVETRFNAAALAARADIDRLNRTLQDKLKGQGLAFNAVDQGPFRETLRKAGYYAQWRTTFGAGPWATLEKYSGPLTVSSTGRQGLNRPAS